MFRVPMLVLLIAVSVPPCWAAKNDWAEGTPGKSHAETAPDQRVGGGRRKAVRR